MKIAHTTLDPQSGYHFAVIVGTTAIASCRVGTTLRCGAYRFEVKQVVAEHPEAAPPAIGLLLKGFDAPTEGMVVHLHTEPLTDEELTTAVQHLLMIPRMLKGVDSRAVCERLWQVKDLPAEFRPYMLMLVDLAIEVAKCTARVPADYVVAEAERYKSEILKAC